PRKSFATKPLWARALIVFAGPAMNFVLAAVIFSGMFLAIGVPVPPPATVGRVLPDSPAARAGLQLADQVAAVDGRPVEHWGQVEDAIARSEGRRLTPTIVRGGQRQDVALAPERLPGRTRLGEATEVWGVGVSPFLPPVVGGLRPNMPAAEAGLRPGDRVVAIDGQPIRTWDEMAEVISKRPG